MGVEHESIGEFLAAVAAGNPTPGGGSTTAVVGAAAAALCEMVCTLSIEAEGYERIHEDLRGHRSKVSNERSSLLELAASDREAFEAVMTAARADDTTAMEAKLQDAADVALEIAEVCASVLDSATVLAEIGDSNTVTDASLAALFAHAGVHGGLDTVAINCTSIGDDAFTSHARGRTQKIRERADDQRTRSRKLFEERCALDLSGP